MTIKMDGAELERIGVGKGAEVFEYGEYVLKLCHGARAEELVLREAVALRAIECTRLPVPRAIGVRQFEDGWGLVMTRAPGQAFAEAMLADTNAVLRHLAAMAALHREIHARRVPSLPDLKVKLAGNIGRAPHLGEAQRQRLLDGLRAMPGGDRLCHGDFHPFNVMGTVKDATIIDWLDATSGPAEADVCRSYVLMHHIDPRLASQYVEAYGASRHIWSWLPYVAAARLAEGVPDEERALLAFARGAES